MAFQNDTGVADAHRTDDQQKIGSGSSTAPGGADAPVQNQSDMTQGQEAYPGGREGGQTDKETTGNETGLNADTPAAGDVDPGSTQSSEETGQDGDPKSPGKNTGNAWNG